MELPAWSTGVHRAVRDLADQVLREHVLVNPGSVIVGLRCKAKKRVCKVVSDSGEDKFRS